MKRSFFLILNMLRKFLPLLLLALLISAPNPSNKAEIRQARENDPEYVKGLLPVVKDQSEAPGETIRFINAEEMARLKLFALFAWTCGNLALTRAWSCEQCLNPAIKNTKVLYTVDKGDLAGHVSV